MIKLNKNTNNDEKKKLLLAQDMKLVKALAGNEKKIRDRALKNLKLWLTQRSSKMAFTHDDYMRIWKGLFCTMWMSDKPLIQEECAENISQLIHHTSTESSLLFFKCGFILMTIEWFGIDQWRLDKFLMLVRRMLRQGFEVLKRNEWNFKEVSQFVHILTETVLKRDNSKFLGLTMHVTEIFLEELAKVSHGKIEQPILIEFLKPFIRQLSTLDDSRHIKHIVKHLFHHLMQQTDEGLEHEAKFNAWRRQGFPGGTLDVMEKMEVESDEEVEDEVNDDVLDPRAGQVDVLLPQLKFDPRMILKLLSEFKFTKKSTTIGKRAIAQLQQEFEKLSKGVYPLGITKVPQPEPDDFIEIENSIDRLAEFEQDLRQDKSKMKEPQNIKKPKMNGFDNSATSLFADQLKQFIKKSEGKIKKKKLVKRKSNKLDPNWSYEDSFCRNSGIWTVYRMNSSTAESSPVIANGISLEKSTESEWSRPLKEGETEIFIPSTKFKTKLKGKNISHIINNKIGTARSLNINNPFAIHSKSEKKVRIALKLNQSQEIHEHVAQLKSSPGIPFDANKKPIKPLLKPNNIKSPINPFYKKKLKI